MGALDKIVAEFKKHGSGSGTAADPHNLVAQLRQQYGSNAAASRATGIADSTLRRWFNGASPSARNAAKAEQASRDVVTPRLDAAGFAIKTQDNKDGRVRTITAEQMGVTQADLDRVREHIVKGNDAAAQKEFLKSVKVPYYRGYLTPGSAVRRTGTVDGLGGGPKGAVRRNALGGDADGDYDDDTSDLAYEGMEGDDGAEYGGQVMGVFARIIAFVTGKGRK